MGLIESEAEQLAVHIDRRLEETYAALEKIILATKVQIEQALTDQSAAFTDYADDVSAKLAELNAKLDAAVADKAQLAELQALTDDVLARTNAMTDAIKAADVTVDRPQKPA